LSSVAAKGRKKAAKVKAEKGAERGRKGGAGEDPPSMLNIGYGNLVAIASRPASTASWSMPRRGVAPAR